MKRYGGIYSKIYNIDNLRIAHKNARRNKLFYKEVKMVDLDEDVYLQQIHQMLVQHEYEVSPYITSKIIDKGKERELCKLPYFPDRIIQWAILLQVEPIFMEVFTNFTYASIKGRGIHKASRLLESYMQDADKTRYCLKFDIRKFYPNINHAILKRLLRKKLKDKDLLVLLDKIIDSVEGNKGIPIGSYLSQFFANFYLSYFDHWLKENMKCKYVIRYMDDIVILHHSKEHLHTLKRAIDEYLLTNLDLDIKKNWQVFPTGIRGVDFVGYRHFYGYKLLRKSTCKRLKKKMLAIKRKMMRGGALTYSEWCSANSYSGWTKWCNGYRLMRKYYEPIRLFLKEYCTSQIKKKKVIQCDSSQKLKVVQNKQSLL